MTARGDSHEEQGAIVTANYFALLGLTPRLGRFFLLEEDAVPDRNAVAVLSYAYWKSRLGGDSGVIGEQLNINGTPFTIVGVAPKDFHGVVQVTDDALYLPAMMIRLGYRWADCFRPPCDALSLLGRLSPGRNPGEARAELAGLYAQLQSTYPVDEPRRGILLAPALGNVSFGTRQESVGQMQLLSSVAGLLLLIACANPAGMLLISGAARQKEMAVRLAMGASRLRLVRQLPVENLLLAAPGGALGLLVSVWARDRLAGYYTMADEGHIGFYYLALDPLVVCYSVAIAAVAGVAFGLLPALNSSRQDLNFALKDIGPARGTRSALLRNALVVGQVALSLSLLVSRPWSSAVRRRFTRVPISIPLMLH